MLHYQILVSSRHGKYGEKKIKNQIRAINVNISSDME